jgi:hypothetical protein
MAADGRIAPGVAEGAGDALAVQIEDDGARRLAGGELAEHAPHNLSLGLVDSALAPDRLAGRIRALHHIIAVAEPAARLPFLHTAAQAAMRLGRKIAKEQGVHGAFESDVQLGDLALCQRHDLHAGKAQMLEQRGHVSLVAADAVQPFRQHHVELAALRVPYKLLDARPQDHTVAGDRLILVGADNLPLLPRRVLAADAELIGDRFRALVVVRIPGVKGNSHGICSSVISRRAWAGCCRSLP